MPEQAQSPPNYAPQQQPQPSPVQVQVQPQPYPYPYPPHSPDCDWPTQRGLVNYKLDAISQATAALNGRLDTVISNQAMAAGTDKYKKNVIPNIIQIGMFLVSLGALLLSLVIMYTRHVGP